MSDDYTPIFQRSRDGLWYPDDVSIEVGHEWPQLLGQPHTAYIRGVTLDITIDEPGKKTRYAIASHDYLGIRAREMVDYGSNVVFGMKIEARMNEQETRELERLLHRVIERVKTEAGIME